MSNLAGVISKVTVTFSNLSHAYPDDIDALLVGPNGQATILMSDAGGGSTLNNVTLTFDDAATNSLPNSTEIQPGIYKPTNYGAGDLFPPPALPGPYGSTLSVFNGSNPNGTWSLFVVDAMQWDELRAGTQWSDAAPAPPASSTLLTNVEYLGNGAFQFTVNGEIGDLFIIEAAPELSGPWTPIATNSLTRVSLDFQDANYATYGRRFYRARRP